MEARKITVYSTKTQKKYVIMTGAETLSELKTDLRSHDIDFSNLTFMEGLTRTELVDDNSVLPTNVPRVDRTTGERTYTNELVFMLTNTSKKIKSGSLRSDLYDTIKTEGLQDEVKKTFGKNFTQVTTADLEKFVANYEYKNEVSKVSKEDSCSGEEFDLDYPAETDVENFVWETSFIRFINDISIVLSEQCKEEIIKVLSNKSNTETITHESKKSSEEYYDDEEIEDLFGFMN